MINSLSYDAAKRVVRSHPFTVVFCGAVTATVLCLLTGAVDHETAPVEVELSEVQPAVFRHVIEKPGVIEPLQSFAVHSECYWNTTILSIVPEGTFVKKGDVVCVLDSSDIEEYAKTRELLLVKFRNRLDNALQDQQLLKSENERRLDAAQFEYQTARYELNEFENGTYPQQIEEMERNLAMLAEQAESAADDMRYTERLWAMGMASQQDVSRNVLNRHRAENKYDQLESELALLSGMLHRRSMLRLEHRASNSHRNVARTRIANSLAVTKSRLTTLAYERSLRIYERYHRRALDSIAACTLRAPCDGQVIHSNSWYLLSRGLTQIEPGSRVRNQQAVFEIPDPTRLKVSVPILESLICHVEKGMAVTVIPAGYEDVEIAGRIVHISRYPRARSSYTPSLKEYWLDVEILPTDEQRELLKPKADASVRMTIRESEDELMIPRNCVQGIAGCCYVYVFDGRELVARRVELGAANEESVCVESGLAAGDQLVTEMLPEHEAALFEQVTGQLKTSP